MSDIRIVQRADTDLLGEGVVWSARRNSVLWVDIFAPALNELELTSGRVTRWPMPQRIGWALEREGRDDLLVGLKTGIAALRLVPFGVEHILQPEPERPHNRLNDATVDASGRIWFGSKDDRDQDTSGALYRLDRDFAVTRHDDGYSVTNGPTFSVDGTRLYHTDSGARNAFVFDLSSDGRIDNKRLFLTFEPEWGYPDGMTTDAEDCIWIAHWGGSRVSRFTPDGRLDRQVSFPTPQISNCAFAGPGLDRMFVTSASAGLPRSPVAGALFEFSPGVRGIQPNLFQG